MQPQAPFTRPRRNRQPRAGLLTIPGELRNRIYELTLIDEVGIVFDKTYRTPGLLSTNRQTRAEASSIYYQDNIFIIPAYDLTMNMPASWWRWDTAIVYRSSVVELDLGLKDPTWEIVVSWLRRVVLQRSDAMTVRRASSRVIVDFARMSRMAQQARGWGWPAARGVLARAGIERGIRW